MGIRKQHIPTLDDIRKIYKKNHIDSIYAHSCVKCIKFDCYNAAKNGWDHYIINWGNLLDAGHTINNSAAYRNFIIALLRADGFTVEEDERSYSYAVVSGWSGDEERVHNLGL